MKTITEKWLKEKKACSDGIEWFVAQQETNTAKVLIKLIEEKRGSDALWVLEKTMDTDQSIKVAIFSARLCLHEFEERHPDDDRPRKAIEAAELYLENPCEKTRSAAFSAARSAASSAERNTASSAERAESAARRAASSAESAASSAASSAESSAARYGMSSAASSAASSAESAASSAESAAMKEAYNKIITYAIDIMGL